MAEETLPFILKLERHQEKKPKKEGRKLSTIKSATRMEEESDYFISWVTS